MTTAFNIAFVLKADPANAKAGLAEVQTGLNVLSAEAQKANASTNLQARALATMTAEAIQAGTAHKSLAAAIPSLTGAWTGARTAAGALQGAVAGLNNSIGQQANDFLAARQEAALYQSMLDDVRAQFSPLFAAQRQYEQQLKRISDAEKLGAINAIEAAEARQRAASMVQTGRVGDTNSAYSSMVAPQLFDTGVTAAMGMNPMQIGLQQGTQIVQVMQQMGGGKQALQGIAAGFMSLLNPINLVTIGVVALGAVGIQALMGLGGGARSFDDALADLEASVDDYAKSSERARRSSAALREEFGSVSEVARQLLQDMADLDRRSATRDVNAVVRGLAGKNGLALQNPEGEADDLRAFFDLSTWKQESWDLARGVRDAYLTSTKADGLDNQIAAVERLKDAYLAAAEASGGITKEEDAGLKNIQTVLDQLVELQAKGENAAGNARADEMVRQLKQRVELQQVALQFGKESAEYRSAEQGQLRQNTVLELGRLGLTEQDQKAKEVLGALARAYFAQEQAANQARQDAQRDYLQGQDDQIAAMQRQGALLGASREDQARINALAEADLEIRRRSLGIDEAREVRAKAIAKAEAEITLERQKAMRAVQVAALVDSYDAQIGLARDPVSKANLEFQKAYTAAVADGKSAELAYAEALQTRNRAMTETLTGAQTSIAGMADELAARQRIAAQVATGLVPAADANRLMREELELRPLIAAAAAAEGTEKRKLLDLIEGMRLAYAALAAEERRAAQNDYLRGGAERTQQLQLELALIGQTAETRARILALVRAEQDIRRLGLEGQAADEARQRELMNTELARQVRAQSDAWAQFQQAGESAIDGVLDKLRGGDFGGALAEMLGELEKGLFDLSIRNPLKNLILGTDLGTMADLGGWSGIWDRITGKAKIDEQAAVSAAVTPVQSMMVQAANVTLAGNLSGFAGLGLSAANSNMPIGMGSLGGRTDVQAQVWQFFAAKGLKPHQIAGIMGNASAESSFNPLAEGDAGQAYGLFQWNDRKGNLFDFIGGKQNLGDIQKQLEFAWHELMTSEGSAFQRLMASTDVRGATEAFLGFERPNGYSAANPAGSMHFEKRLADAQAALTTFTSAAQQAVEPVGAMGTGAQAATGALGEMGAGMGSFGMALQQILAGGLQGGGDGALGGLLSWGISLLGGLPGFASGGDHRGGWRIVGENGPELEATGASRIFSASQTRDIFTSRAPAPPMAQSPQQGGGKMDVHINLSGAKGDKEIAELVQSSVSAAIETYDRRALPNRVTAVIKDMRKVG